MFRFLASVTERLVPLTEMRGSGRGIGFFGEKNQEFSLKYTAFKHLLDIPGESQGGQWDTRT